MRNIYEDLLAWGDCGIAANAYRAHNIKSHAQAWDMLVASDKHKWLVWLALHAHSVPRKTVKAFLDETVERAIRNALDIYADPTFVAWANRWLSGEDLTTASVANSVATWERPASAAWAAASWTLAWLSESRTRTVPAYAEAWSVALSAAAVAWAEDARESETRQQADWWRKQKNLFKE